MLIRWRTASPARGRGTDRGTPSPRPHRTSILLRLKHARRDALDLRADLLEAQFLLVQRAPQLLE